MTPSPFATWLVSQLLIQPASVQRIVKGQYDLTKWASFELEKANRFEALVPDATDQERFVCGLLYAADSANEEYEFEGHVRYLRRISEAVAKEVGDDRFQAELACSILSKLISIQNDNDSAIRFATQCAKTVSLAMDAEEADDSIQSLGLSAVVAKVFSDKGLDTVTKLADYLKTSDGTELGLSESALVGLKKAVAA